MAVVQHRVAAVLAVLLVMTESFSSITAQPFNVALPPDSDALQEATERAAIDEAGLVYDFMKVRFDAFMYTYKHVPYVSPIQATITFFHCFELRSHFGCEFLPHTAHAPRNRSQVSSPGLYHVSQPPSGASIGYELFTCFH